MYYSKANLERRATGLRIPVIIKNHVLVYWMYYSKANLERRATGLRIPVIINSR